MHHRVLPAPQRPAPWLDRPAEWPVLLRPAASWTAEALTSIGSTPGDGPLLLTDDLLVSPELLQAFVAIAGARPSPRHRVACLGPGVAATRLAGRSLLPPGPDGSLPLPLLYLGDGAPPTSAEALWEAAASAEPVVLDAQEQVRDVPVPRAWADPGKETMTLAASRRVGLHLSHRTALLEANLALLGASFLRTLGRPKLLLLLRYLLDRLRPGRRLFSRVGRGCRIHPTAIVEASSLGDGVEIGAYAIVRAAVLGDGATVEDGGQVQFAVVGPKARVARQTYLFASVLMEGAHSAQPIMQASVLGRHAATTSASWFTDVHFERDIRVEGPSGLLDAGTRFLGCDVGHGTVVGAGVIVAPGRALPSGVRVVGDPRGVAIRTAVDAPEGATLAVIDGALVVQGGP